VRIDAVRILLVAAVAVPLFAVWSGQDGVATDWPKEVERACTSPRYGLRLAASRKVAKGGAAAVDAIRAHAAKVGLNEVPAALVDAIADDGTDERPVLDLLLEWSHQDDFYWRASALRGVALRAPRLPEKPGAAVRAVLERYHTDPAWLMRTHARLGTVLCGDAAPLALPEADPRARTQLALLLLKHGPVPPLQPLLDALADERTFLEVPWARSFATEAFKALKNWLGEQHPAPAGSSFDESVGDKAAALRAMRDACAQKSGQTLAVPEVRRDPDVAFAGGIELLSCKHGDQFVRWTAAGDVHLGIDAATTVRVPADAWQRLDAERRALALPEAMGAVVCDALRLRWNEPKVHAKAAPASLPQPAARWLEALADAIGAAGDERAAASLRTAIGQFAAR
jgi:hypothetical protein